MKMRFHSHANQTHFHVNGWAPGVALIERLRSTWKWAIGIIRHLQTSKMSLLSFLFYIEIHLVLLTQNDVCLVTYQKSPVFPSSPVDFVACKQVPGEPERNKRACRHSIDATVL